MTETRIEIQTLASLSEIDAAEWDACAAIREATAGAVQALAVIVGFVLVVRAGLQSGRQRVKHTRNLQHAKTSTIHTTTPRHMLNK